MNITLFETRKVEHLAPITLTRPCYEILCAGTTLLDAAKLVLKPKNISSIVRPHLKKISEQKVLPTKKPSDVYLFVNASVVPDLNLLHKLNKLVSSKKNFIIKNRKEIVAAYFSCKELGIQPSAVSKLQYGEVEEFLNGLKLKNEKLPFEQFEYLWDVAVNNQKIIRDNLEILKKNYKELQKGVHVGKGVTIYDNVVFDTGEGPIIIDDKTKVSSFTVLRGPLYIGKSSIIKSFCEIKLGCSIGDVCRIGGEVDASVFQAYSNKPHYGYIGNSYIGEWVNLGGGTSNSNLKSTYGEIKMERIPTGQQFLGCVIGDYTKASVGTLIYTGKVIGVNSYLYGTVTTDVPSFTNYVAPYKGMIEVPLVVGQKVQKKVFDRRGIKQNAAHKKLLEDVYSMTAKRRKAFSVKKGKLVI